MSKFSLSIAILFSTFFSPYLFATSPLVNCDDQKEGFSAPTEPLVATPKQLTVCDYTLLNNKNVNHTLNDIEDVEDDLGDYVSAVNAKLVTTNNKTTPLLLGAVLQHKQSHEYHQYLITDTGLLSETTQFNAVKRAYRKGFHLIQANRGHVSLQLLEWLQISKHYTVIALHTNKPVCSNCYLIAHSLWKKKLQSNEKGCVGMTFPLLDKMPKLAQKYINTHLNLSLVQSLVVPIMGYVSKEEMNKATQKNKEMDSFIASMQELNNKQIAILSKQVKTKNIQLNEQNKQIQLITNKLNNKDERIETLSNQLNDKNQELDDLKAQLRKCREKNTGYQNITEKLNELHNEFKMQINNIDIQNENSVKSFVLKVKEEHKQFDEDMQTLRKWYAKYKGDDWKHFHQQNSDGISRRKIYDVILEKMEKIRQNNKKGTIFSSILQSLKTVLSTKLARLWGVNEALDQNSLKNQKYRLEISRTNDKLQPPFLHAAKKGNSRSPSY